MDGAHFCEFGSVEGVVGLLLQLCGELVRVGDAHGGFGGEQEGESLGKKGLMVGDGEGVCPAGGGVDDLCVGGRCGGGDGASNEFPA